MRSLLIVDDFAPEHRALRLAFDERFAEPRRAKAGRFVWDYWHVPGQYTALRTPAWELFPTRTYRAFHRRLVDWGRRTLGCHDISPPWLSCYVDGCRQELHGDLPHGPFAFVYSLTNWTSRVFRGGETLMLRDEVLDWWSDFVSTRSVEEDQVLRAIPAERNRLVVFDPRIPHGVRRVEGTQDVREGRLVIHGWFVQPRPFVEGGLPARALASRVEDVSAIVAQHLEAGLALTGSLSIQFSVRPNGRVGTVRVLADTTRVPREMERSRRALLRDIERGIARLDFPRARTSSRMTLPLVFVRD